MIDTKEEKQQGNAESSKKKNRCIVTWTQEEDDILREQIRIHGTENWAVIASKFKDKTTRQCRRRWFTYLNSNFKKGGWTSEEDTLLCEAQKVFGNRWTEIAKVVSGRTDNAVKNRFSTLRKKREKYALVEKENIISKRNIPHQGYTNAMSESAVPVKKMRRAHIPDDANKIDFGDRSHLRNAITINQQPRAPLAELAKKSICVDNIPDRLHVFNGKFKSSDQNNKSQLKKSDSKISELIQIIDSENIENVWKPLLEFMNRTDTIGEKIEVLQLVSRRVNELKSSNDRGHSRMRQMEPNEDSQGNSEFSSVSTMLPTSTGTGDNVESSSNQDIGTEIKATQGDKKAEVESVKEVFSTVKVEQDMIPYGEEQINASSRMKCSQSPLQVTPIFRSLAEGIPSPEFSESEKTFLRKTLGVESPSMNTTFNRFKPPPCTRSLQYDQ